MRCKQLGYASFAVIVLLLGVGTAQAQTIKGCEQTIQYNLVPPAADVPAAFSAFSGAWLGNWSGKLCSALIVEQIDKDGTVRAKYMYGTYKDWNITKAGIFPTTGKIVNGVLTFRQRNDTVTVEYRVTSPTELSGAYTAQTQEQGVFKRQ